MKASRPGGLSRNVVPLALLTSLLFAVACSQTRSHHGSKDAGSVTTDLVPVTDVNRMLSVKDVHTVDSKVTGKLVNHSSSTLRDVQLVIQHAWLWKNERHPGKDSPGRSEYYLVLNDIPPSGTVDFEYHADPPLAKRSDGHYETKVSVSSFTEVSH